MDRFTTALTLTGDGTFVFEWPADGTAERTVCTCDDKTQHQADAEMIVKALNASERPMSLEQTLDAANALADRECSQARVPAVRDFLNSIAQDIATVRAKLLRLEDVAREAMADRAFLEPLESDTT